MDTAACRWSYRWLLHSRDLTWHLPSPLKATVLHGKTEAGWKIYNNAKAPMFSAVKHRGIPVFDSGSILDWKDNGQMYNACQPQGTSKALRSKVPFENLWINIVLSAAHTSEGRVNKYCADDHLNNMTASVIYKTLPESEHEVSNSSKERQRKNEANYSYSHV